jgi:UDP-N-acetylmuramoyl-tripeptide--D-alanyl-D-alanine ligase
MPAILPSIGVITNLGLVHLETFGSRDAIADGKWELIEGLIAGGTAVLPDNEPRLRRPHPGPTVTFGTAPDASVRITDLSTDDQGRPSFVLHTHGRSFPVSLRMSGAHNALNAAAAFAAATAIGVPAEVAIDGMSTAAGSAWRMEIRSGRYTVVNDSYNANPTSMTAALQTVAAMPGRSYAVLGEMAELGDATDAEHERIGRLAAELGIELVVSVGPDHGLAKVAGGINVASPSDALDVVRKRVRDGDVVLIKASRSVGLEELAGRLIEGAFQ